MTPEEAREMLIRSLIFVRQQMDKGEDDWRYSLLRVFREYGQALGIDPLLLHPIQRMLFEAYDFTIIERRGKKEGRRPMPAGKQTTLLVAAAAVTILKKRGQRIPDAIKLVARTTGLDRKDIRGFRDDLNRGKFGPDVDVAYRNCIIKISGWPADRMLDGLLGLNAFVP